MLEAVYREMLGLRTPCEVTWEVAQEVIHRVVIQEEEPHRRHSTEATREVPREAAVCFNLESLESWTLLEPRERGTVQPSSALY